MNRNNQNRIITFHEILEFASDNAQIYNDLVKKVKAGANCLVPFVGAGLSSPVYKLWKPSLQAIAEKFRSPENRKTCEDLLNNCQYEEAAQFLEDKRQPVNLARDFQELYNPATLQSNAGKIQKMAVWLLPYLFKGLAITTNLDRMLEYVYDVQNLPFSNVLLPGEREQLRTENLRRHDAHFLYKFHGTVEADGSLDYEKTVFTKRQYEESYGDNTPLVALQNDFYKQKPLLFLGCSLQADRTLDVLKEILRPGINNYAILPCKSEDMDDRISFLGGLGIRAVFYPDGEYESVRIILEQMLLETDPEGYKLLSNPIGIQGMKTEEELYNNRFQYNSGLYAPVDREEINDLQALLNDGASFRWWALTGPGGTGKSRLALTLTERLPDGWESRLLSRNDYKNGLENLRPARINTLYIADYVQAYTVPLGDWINAISRAAHSVKVRILLLERDGGDWAHRLRQCFKGNTAAEAAEFRREDGFLTLKTMSDDKLLTLMDRYAEAVFPLSARYKQRWLGTDAGKPLLDALGRVDPDLRRPLYALLLTDSWLTGKSPETWNREELLGYVLDKEERYIEERIEQIVRGQSDRLTRDIYSVLRIATALQDVDTNDLAQLCPYWEDLEHQVETLGFISAEDLLTRLGLSRGETMLAMRPDILGEFLVLRWMKGEQTKTEEREAFLQAIWHKPLNAAIFLDRIISDFADILDEKPGCWRLLLSNQTEWLTLDTWLFSRLLVNATGRTQLEAVAKSCVNLLEAQSKAWPKNLTIAIEYAKGLFNLSNKQDVDAAADILDRLEALSKAWPKNITIAIEYAKGLFNLSNKQDVDAAADTLDRLEALSKAWPKNITIAMEYAKGLVNLVIKQDANGAAATLERLETHSKVWPKDREIELMLAQGLVNLSYKQDAEGAAATVERLEAHFNAWPEDREIALELAKGMYNLVAMQDDEGAAATVDRLEAHSKAWLDNREITLVLARGLVNLSNKQDADAAAATMERLEAYSKALPENREIALVLAKGMLNLSNKQDSEDATDTLERLEAYFKTWPEDQEIALQLAKGLVNLVTTQDTEGATATMERLETYSKTWPENREIALAFAKGMVNLSYRQDAEDATFTVDWLEAHSKAWPKDREIALAFAQGLVNLVDAQDTERATATVDRLEDLSKAWPKDREIALAFAQGLFNLSYKQDIEGVAATLQRLEAYFKVWQEDRGIVIELAQGLFNLSNMQEAKSAAATVELLEACSKAWPEDREIALVLAKCLVNLVASQNNAEASATAKRLEAHFKAWPEDREIALAFAKGLVNLSYKQDAEDATANVDRLEVHSKAWPKDREIALAFSMGLVNLVDAQDAESATTTVDRLEAQCKAWPKDREIALAFAKGLVNLSCKQDAEGAAATVERLEAHSKAWSEDLEIALAFAQGLFNLSYTQDADGAAATVNRLKTHSKAWVENREIALEFAKAMVNLVAIQDTECAAATVDRLEVFSTAWPEDREIALELAKGLFTLADKQDAEKAAATVDLLEANSRAWPEDREIALLLASALFNLCLNSSKSNEVDRCLNKLIVLQKRYPKDDLSGIAVSSLLAALVALFGGNEEQVKEHLVRFSMIQRMLSLL